MKEIDNYSEYPGTEQEPKEKLPIILHSEPRDGKEVMKLIKLQRKHPRLLIMFSGPRKEKP